MHKKKYKKLIALFVFLFPSIMGLLVFVIAPILSSFTLSFTSWDLIGPIQWNGITNFVEIFNSKDFYNALLHTLTFIVGYLPLVMAISLLTAVLLNQKIKGVSFFRAIYFLPVISSWVAVSIIWRWLFNPQYGIVNYILSLVGIHGPAWLYDAKWAMPAIILTSVWKDIGFVMVMFLAGLQGIPGHLYEAAKIDGANAVKRFFKITLPLLSPTTYFVLIISLINSFQVFDQVWIMTEGGPAGATSVLVEQIYKNAFSYNKMGYASAMSWILFAIIFIVTLIQNRLQKRWVDYEI